MNKKNTLKTVILFISVLIIIFFISVFGIYRYKCKIKNTIGNYSILHGTVSDEMVDYLKSTIKSDTNMSLFKYNKISSFIYDNVIIMTNDITSVHNMGIAGYGVSDGDYLLYRYDNILYIYAADNDTLKLAINCLINKYLDENGNVLLSEGKTYHSSGEKMYCNVYIDDVPIDNYVIVYENESEKAASEKLQYYIAQSCGIIPSISSKNKVSEDSYCILISVSDTLSKDSIEIKNDGNILSICATDNDSLFNAVYRFANRYLGWYYAGTSKEHFSCRESSLHIKIVSDEDAWIEQREPIITLWNTNYPRGFYLSSDVSLMTDVMSFSDDQLYDYVRMMQYCGYNGIQVTDMCSAWAGAGGYESVQDKIRVMFDAAHCLGMNTTLWVWGSEFDGYGWFDPNVTVTPYDENVRDNQEAYDVFNEYYDKYAELADCTDRVIAHFYDPGNLSDATDIAFYSRLLWSKFSAVNPNVNFGISCWADAFDKSILYNELGSGFTIYEGTVRNNESGYEDFRSFVGCRDNELGTWSWNNCEMEIDQLAQLDYNVDMIKSTYIEARKYDSICKPDYWSEMDSNHVINIFSLYSAGELLKNPDLDTKELTEKIALDAVGPEYASDFADLLLLIQKARCGGDWNSFFWSMDNYILLSDDYPAETILVESEQALTLLDEMINSEIESYSLPLPISMTDLLSLMRPQIQQIHDYANFRIALNELETECGNSEMNDEFLDYLETEITKIGEPIKEYNCIIGSWGQIEARAQQNLVSEFCKKYNIAIPHYAQYDVLWKYRIRSQFASYQRGEKEPVYFTSPYYQYGYAMSIDETERLVNEMIEDGTLTQGSNGSVCLSGWDNYIYMTTY